MRSIHLPLLASLLLTSTAVWAKVYQCDDGNFSDQPCADGASSLIVPPPPPPAEPRTSADGSVPLAEIRSAEGAGSAADDGSEQCDANDFETKTMIAQGLREWRVVRCMSMLQVQKVTRDASYQEFSHTNGQQQRVIEWVYAEGSPQRITFIDNRAVKLR